MNKIPTLEPVDVDALPLAVPVDAHYEQAAELLERVVDAGTKDPAIHYLLAMAFKRQQKWPQARNVLRKIPKPDANIFLQMGILSLKEKQLAQAEGDFVRSLQLDPNLFATAYNLTLTRVSLGNLGGAVSSCHQAISLAPAQVTSRILTLLYGLLLLSQRNPNTSGPTAEREKVQQIFQNANENDENQLLKLIRSIGHMDAVYALLKAFVSIRPQSSTVREAYYEGVLLKARYLMQRCNWSDAQNVLSTLVHQKNVSRSHQVAMQNLLGCCACVTQDFDKAIHHFQSALKIQPDDLRLNHNLALTLEFNARLNQAANHWDDVFDLLNSRDFTGPEEIDDFQHQFEYEALIRLAGEFTEKARWNQVLTYLHRAHRLRPEDVDLMERLFHVYQQAEQPNNARKMLDRMRDRNPNDPQLELYELDLVDVRGLADIEYLLTEIEDILHRYPDDHRVRDRAVGMVSNVIPLMSNLCEQLNEQLDKVYRQVRNLPKYQIDWDALNEIMRDLAKEFRKLKRITAKCLPLVTHEEHKQIVRELQEHIEDKIEACRRLME